jgi:transglutaminase-like putative cysteine protease
MDVMGLDMVSYSVPKGVALEKIAGAELDLAVKTLVRTQRIQDAYKTKKAVYRIKHPEADPSKFLINGGNQSVRRISEHEAELTVTALRPKASVRVVKTEEQYSDASRYLQIRDRNVIRHAERAAGNAIDPWRSAVKMEKYVNEKLVKKNFSTALASAAEVAKDLQGDCTEHAVLLAAMLRVKRIPSRLCVGLVYIDRESAFGGHMWTEAYIGGEWIPLDATLGKGGIGAAHIKLAQSSFADSAAEPATAFLPLLNALGKMEIEVVSTK